MRDPSELLSQARVLPKYEQGQMVGLQVNGIKPGSLFQEIGLQEGDLITQFNGIAIDSPDQSAQDLPGARERIGIQRGRARRRWHRVDQELHAGVSERVAIQRNRRIHPAARLARAWLGLLVLCAIGAPLAARAQAQPAAQPGARPTFEPGAMVTLDFADAELAQVIETIARATNRNFIYDDRVRGRVTIVSPEPIPVEQAYAVFESVLQVKGFTTVTTPGGAIKVVPVREAKESSIETVRSSQRPPNRDTFVTRLIPLRYIDADSIVNTLKPLVSKDAAMAAYAPTNTVILTESASNIRRLIAILESIDVETYKEDLAVINVEYADAATLADQVSEIYGAEVAEGGGAVRLAPRRAPPRRPIRATRTRAAERGQAAGADPHRRAHELAARARAARAARRGAPPGREARRAGARAAGGSTSTT